MRKILIIMLVLLVLSGAAAAIALSTIKNLLKPVDALAVEKYTRVSIPQGSSTHDIAGILEEAGIIQSAAVFRLYVRLKENDRSLIAGDYLLSPSMTVDDILLKLQKGEVEKNTQRFTIPEGFTVEQIASRLGELGLADTEQIRQLAREPSPGLKERFPFLDDIPADTIYLLEGYLFPDTYEIREGAPAEEIISLMLHRFATVFREEHRLRSEELGLTMHQALTLASIIEREAAVSAERPLISAVFHNRLAKDYPLESCATVQYVLGETKPVLSLEDMRIESPYNTYIINGLPPGPIAAPGSAAIEAALNPAESDYFFFLAKEDGTGEHYFSKTLEEHNRYKREVQGRRR